MRRIFGFLRSESRPRVIGWRVPPCTRRMHVHLSLLRMNVHPVLHLHGISGTIMREENPT